MSLFLAASFISIIVSHAILNDSVTWNSDFRIIESTERYHVLQCKTEGAYISDSFLNTYEIYKIVEKAQYNPNFNKDNALSCVDSNNAITLNTDYFCTFKESISKYIYPKDLRFHDNEFICGNKLLIAFCDSGAENRIKFDYSGATFPANEVNLHSLCNSRCNLLKFELGNYVQIEISINEARETLSLKCNEGYEFIGFEEQSLDLVCNRRYGYWSLQIPGESVVQVIRNPVQEFFCRAKRESERSDDRSGNEDQAENEESEAIVVDEIQKGIENEDNKKDDGVSVEALASSLCEALGWLSPRE